MTSGALADSLSLLRQFAGKRRSTERCELCGMDLTGDHAHLVDPKARKLACACDACAILFSSRSGAQYKRVPREIKFLAGFRLTDAEWESLMIPINMAFCFKSSVDDKVIALYPSPAGATESQLPLDTWSAIVAENPVLGRMGQDVEALLVNRLGPARGYTAAEYYLLPIDECYKLVWLIRSNWKGLSGGADLWKQLESFFADLKGRSGVLRHA
jgi:Family of unknown function (DUF5947)